MIPEMIEQAAAFEKSGQLDLAQNIYNVALDLLPQSETEARARILLRRGRLRYRLKNAGGAMDDLRQALALAPSLAEEINFNS